MGHQTTDRQRRRGAATRHPHGESTPGSGEAFYSGWRPWLYGAVNAILPMGSLGLLLLLCRIASRPPCSEACVPAALWAAWPAPSDSGWD